jgi:hypothetical protein
MPPPYRPYIPQTLGDLLDLLGLMMLRSPTFADTTGYFPERNIDTVFYALNEGLDATRKKLGEDRYQKLTEMSKQMRVLFAADPEDTTGDARKGQELIFDMTQLIKSRPKAQP